MQYKAQNSITITRLKTGDSLYFDFISNGKSLYQSVDESGTAKPDFTIAENQPAVTPQCTSMRGNVVTLSNHQWVYNYTTLVFNGETSDGYTKDSTGKFAMKSDGTFKIIANLASKTNDADDVLTYSAVATVAGSEYPITKTVTITIAKLGANPYNFYLYANPMVLSEEATQTTVKAGLMKDGVDVDKTSYYMKVMRGSDVMEVDQANKTFVVKRDDVDYGQIFVARAYESSSATTPIAVATINIIDNADEYKVELKVQGGQSGQVDSGSSVTVSCVLYRNGEKYTAANPSYLYQVYRQDGDWGSPIRSVETDTITISTDDTDYTDSSGNQKTTDVTVVAMVTI